MWSSLYLHTMYSMYIRTQSMLVPLPLHLFIKRNHIICQKNVPCTCELICEVGRTGFTTIYSNRLTHGRYSWRYGSGSVGTQRRYLYSLYPSCHIPNLAVNQWWTPCQIIHPFVLRSYWYTPNFGIKNDCFPFI